MFQVFLKSPSDMIDMDIELNLVVLSKDYTWI